MFANTFMVISLFNYSLNQFISSTLFLTLLYISLVVISHDCATYVSYFYIICYYFKLRIHLLNQQILILSNNISILQIALKRKLIHEHNTICLQIKMFNTFWKKFYLSMLMCNMPANLVELIMILFTDLEIVPFILSLFITTYTWVFVFFISFCASQVSKGIHLSHNRLFVLQFNIRFNTRVKLKLMTFIEKLLSKHLITGFSVGPLFVMTFPNYSFVCINYHNYVLKKQY